MKKRDNLITLILSLGMCLSIVMVYYQVYHHDFIIFDDSLYVYENEHVLSGLNINSVRWSFQVTGTSSPYWHPVTWISHMIDVEMFGLNPGFHHLTNMAIHILNTLLLFLVLRTMTGSVWRSAFVAMLFGIHPINVETVAWIAERKNLLSTLFWLLTMLAYTRYAVFKRWRDYLLMAGAFTFGTLAKPMLITLPFVLLLLDFWPLKRLDLASWKKGRMTVASDSGKQVNISEPISSLIFEKIPLLIISGMSILVSTFSLRAGGEMISSETVPYLLRLENATISYLSYLIKAFCPYNLTFFYPYPESVPLWMVISSLGVLGMVTVLTIRFASNRPYMITGWLWYLGTLVPVSGIIQGGLWPAIAERWAYIPLIGIFIMLAWGIPELVWKRPRLLRILPGFAVLLFTLLMVVSWIQVRHWKDDLSLNRHGLEVNDENHVAHANLGMAYLKEQRIAEAEKHFLKAIQIRPDCYISYTDLGIALMEQGRIDEALGYFNVSLSLEPRRPETHYNLGNAYARKGELGKATHHYLEALHINPRYLDALNNLGNTFVLQGKDFDAAIYYRKALEIRPGYAKTQANLKALSIRQEKIDAAISKALEELQRNPGRTDLMQLLARSYINKGEYTLALNQLLSLNVLDPDNAETWYNIACMQARLQRPGDAAMSLEKALDLGFRDRDLILFDDDLKNLRDETRFEDIARKYGIKLP